MISLTSQNTIKEPVKVDHASSRQAENQPVVTPEPVQAPSKVAEENQFIYKPQARITSEEETVDSSRLCISLSPLIIFLAIFFFAVRVLVNRYFEEQNRIYMEDFDPDRLSWIAFQEKLTDLCASSLSLILLLNSIGYPALLFVQTLVLGSPEYILTELESDETAVSLSVAFTLGAFIELL